VLFSWCSAGPRLPQLGKWQGVGVGELFPELPASAAVGAGCCFSGCLMVTAAVVWPAGLEAMRELGMRVVVRGPIV
jgi:hypothetical protein